MRIIAAAFTALLTVAATDLAVRHAECGVGCRRGGWDDGAYRPKERDCYCVEYIPFEEITGKRLVLGKKSLATKPDEPAPQARPINTEFPWSF